MWWFFEVCEIPSALWAAPLGKGSGLCSVFFGVHGSPQPFGQLPLERGAVCVVFFGVCEIPSALWAAPLGKGSGLCGGFFSDLI